MRLVDADALYEKTAEWEAQALHMVEMTMRDEDNAEWRRWSAVLTERSAFKHDVADAPTIDAVPVVHGEWIVSQTDYGWNCAEFPTHCKCGQCGREIPYQDKDNFCPRCGAKMDRGAKNG